MSLSRARAGSQPHALTGLYATGSTCASKNGQGYATSYDAFGNVSSRIYNNTTATLSYDTQDHFVEWNAGASSQEWYLYDASGQRVLRRSTNSSNTTLTVYAFGLEEHVYSSSGSNQGNTYYYTLGGQLLGKSDEGSTTFFQTDLQGSVVANWSNTAGSAALRGNQVYGPYGKQRYNQGTHGTPKGFTGQYADSVTGLDYYNARYYDPVAGVFLSADTVQGNAGGMGPFAYVGGNPETYTDPSGQMVVPDGGGVGAAMCLLLHLHRMSATGGVGPSSNGTTSTTMWCILSSILLPSKRKSLYHPSQAISLSSCLS